MSGVLHAEHVLFFHLEEKKPCHVYLVFELFKHSEEGYRRQHPADPNSGKSQAFARLFLVLLILALKLSNLLHKMAKYMYYLVHYLQFPWWLSFFFNTVQKITSASKPLPPKTLHIVAMEAFSPYKHKIPCPIFKKITIVKSK